MTPERWRRVKEILQDAQDRDAGERSTFLDGVCAGDWDLRREVEALLAVESEVDAFLSAPLAKVEAVLKLDQTAQCPTGRRLGPYQIVREIGHGGMGTVYLGERADGQFRKRVAIKLVNSHLAAGSILTRFRKERQVLADLDHPNIARLLDGGATEDSLPFLVMEYVEGERIDNWCENPKLNVRERLKLFQSVCAAVQYAHERQVIHRDIKPANILVTATGTVKLLDFGIAKVLNPVSSREATEVTAGPGPMTPEYASPEQLRGERISAATDVYALGVVLFRLLTGTLPCAAQAGSASPATGRLCEQNSPKPSLVSGNRKLAGDLDYIVMKALRKEPRQRYGSAAALSHDIDRYLKGLPVQVCGSPLYRGRKFLSRNRTILLVASASAMMGIGLVTGLERIGSFGRSFGVGAPASGPRGELPLDWFVGAAIILLVSAIAWVIRRSRRLPASKAIDTLAVLPFQTVGGKERDEYLELGMADALITRLSKVRQLSVRPTSAVRPFSGTADALAAGKQLRASAVVDGSLQKVGERIRVSVRLLRVADGKPLWADTYDEAFTDIFALQDSVSARITSALSISLSGEERDRLTSRHVPHSEAYQLYLRGRYFWERRTEPDVRKAMAFFEQAIQKDPRYAPAHAALANCYGPLVQWHVGRHSELLPKMEEAIRRALELDESLAEAHTALAAARFASWDFEGAERESKRSIELNPSDSLTHRWYGFYMGALGRHDIHLTETRCALDLDPLNGGSNWAFAWALAHAGRFDEALAQTEATLELDPNFVLARGLLAELHAKMGRYSLAREECQNLKDLLGLAFVEAHAGNLEEARAVLARFLQSYPSERPLPQTRLACLYALLGDTEEVFRQLNLAYQEHDVQFPFARSVQELAPLRKDPRMVTLLGALLAGMAVAP